MHRFLVSAAFAVLSTSRLLGYGPAGHEAVGNIAAEHLKGTRAEKEVGKLLEADESLARASTWADRAKFDDKYLTDEMRAFVAANPEHHTYHYCDVPFQQKTYRAGAAGTRENDIVHLIQHCIRNLQKPTDEADNELKINKRVALRLLTHFVGDLHQPLHVGCSWVSEENEFVDPDTGAKGQCDEGGNCFRLAGKTNLHGYWDTLTVKAAHDRAAGADFAAWLMAEAPVQPAWKGEGALAAWPVQWAGESVRLAEKCFDGIQLGERSVVPASEKQPEHFEWKITLPDGYDERSRDIVETELAKAGYRLAEVLKAVWPDT